MEECKVDLVVVSLINRRQMLGSLLHQGHKNQAQEDVGDTTLDDVLDLLDQKDGEKGNDYQRNPKVIISHALIMDEWNT